MSVRIGWGNIRLSNKCQSTGMWIPKITKRGANAFLETNAGPKKIRSWGPERAEWNLTRLGRRFFRDRPSEYLISIPVQYSIIRERDNALVQYRGYIPIT